MPDFSGFLPPDAQRSRVMAAVKGKNTGPERHVRALLFAAGYRYRIHVRALPGAPDIYFGAHCAAIFVHGCFWHHHGCDKGGRLPTRNAEYWRQKILGNAERDARFRRELHEKGVRVLYIWECALKGKQKLSDAALREEISDFLHDPTALFAQLP